MPKKHFKLLQINGLEVLDSTHYPHLSALCYIRLKKEFNKTDITKNSLKTKCSEGIIRFLM